MSRMFLAGASALALFACGSCVLPPMPPPRLRLLASRKSARFGYDAAGMDKSVTPGNDWGRYANGAYLDKLEIPADRSNYGMFTKLRDLSQERTREIVEAAAAKPGAKGTEAQKVGDYYASYMDEAGIEAKGLAPVKPLLDNIAAINDRAMLAKRMGELGRDGVDMPIGASVFGDLKNPDIISAYVGQGGLGLPDRDYYLDDKNPKFAEVRTKYVAHIDKDADAGRHARCRSQVRRAIYRPREEDRHGALDPGRAAPDREAVQPRRQHQHRYHLSGRRLDRAADGGGAARSRRTSSSRSPAPSPASPS